MSRPQLLRVLALATLACCLAALVLGRGAKHGTPSFSNADLVQPAGQAAARAAASPPPAAGPAASPSPPTTLEAVCTAELLCRLAGSGRRRAAECLLSTPQAWPPRSMRALAGMRFASARLTTPVQGGQVRLRVRVHVPATTAAGTTRVLVFVLGAGPDGWQAVSVRPVGLPRADAPPR